MRRSQVDVGYDYLLWLIKDELPEDAVVTSVSVEQDRRMLRVQYTSEQAVNVPDGCEAPTITKRLF